MNMQESESAAVDTLVELGEHLFATRSSNVFAAKLRQTGEPVAAFILRCLLSPTAEGAELFRKRIEIISRLPLATPYIRQFGVDAGGKAFVITDPLVGDRLTKEEWPVASALALFSQAVAIVAQLHQADLVVGDISEESFRLDNHSRVLLVGILGPFEMDTAATTSLPPTETLRFLSPEQRMGNSPVRASDVYSLGALGYRILTGRFLQGDNISLIGADEETLLAPPPSAVRGELPRWLDDLLGKCLETKPEDRFATASDLLECLRVGQANGVIPYRTSRFASKTMVVRPEAVNSLRNALVPKASPRPTVFLPSSEVPRDGEAANRQLVRADVQDKLPEQLGSPRWVKLGALGVLCGAIGLVGFLVLRPEEVVIEPVLQIEFKLSDELQSLLREVVTGDEASRGSALRLLVNSETGGAGIALANAARQLEAPELRKEVVDMTCQRLHSREQQLAALIVCEWIAAKRRAGLDPATAESFIPVSYATERVLTVPQRERALRNVFSKEPMLGLQLAAAIASDEEGELRFVEVLRNFLITAGVTGIEGRGVGAMLLAHPRLVSAFESHLGERLENFSLQDLSWGLLKLADTDSELLFTVTDEILRRRIVPPFQAEFLKSLSEADRATLTRVVRGALVRGARGEFLESDIVAISRWGGARVDRVLLAMCAIAPDQELAQSAFDTLAAREISDPLASKIVEWVKSYFWEYRKRVIKAIGILGLFDIATADQRDFALDLIEPLGTEQSLLRVLMSSPSEDVLLPILERFGKNMRSQELLGLLEHQSKRVRIVAITALADRNELGVLQAVYRAFDRETDPEVKEAYRQYHWVTRDREGGAATSPG